MVSCARATRGLGRPSLDTRSGRPSSSPSRERVVRSARSLRPLKDGLAFRTSMKGKVKHGPSKLPSENSEYPRFFLLGSY